jgi:predicted lipid-binding transport protein (Tim44 family)
MSRKTWLRLSAGCLAFLFLLFCVLEGYSSARIGGGGSFGSRGSRSFSSPSRSSSSYSSSPSRTYQPPAQPSSPSQPAGGGFFRNMMGGMAGGFLGSMLFRGLGFGGGWGGGGGGGIGLFEILILALILYLAYRFIKKRRAQATEDGSYGYYGSSAAEPVNQPSYGAQQGYGSPQQDTSDVATGLSHIRQLDPYFDEAKFRDTCMDTFFKLQGAWGIRDVSSVRDLMTGEVYRRIEDDATRLRTEKKINKLDNIAVRSTDIVEAWQESGQDYITIHFYANLLDYTIDEATGQIVSGSKTDPVKFEEYWTFTRPVGNNPWKLSAINQAD